MAHCRFTSNIEVTEIQSVGGDHMVVAAAKVSTSGLEAFEFALEGKTPEDKKRMANENYGLINYLMKHRHGTPFEHCFITIFVHAPIFVWREWHRHRIGFSYNEESGRYKQLEPVFYLPARDRPMMKVDGWKPGRPKFLYCSDDEEYVNLCQRLQASYEAAYAMYEANLAAGFDPGLARDCLPVGIYSGCWVSMNPRSLMAFLSLRTHEETAKFVSYPLHEIEVAARKVEKIFADWMPLTYTAFVENGRVGP